MTVNGASDVSRGPPRKRFQRSGPELSSQEFARTVLIILGDNGKENGNYHNILGIHRDNILELLGFRV